jgi:phosphate uptake regulator
MTFIHFARLVYKMRQAQQRYFEKRTNEDLRESKRLENEVDKLLGDLIKETKQAAQLTLGE